MFVEVTVEENTGLLRATGDTITACQEHYRANPPTPVLSDKLLDLGNLELTNEGTDFARLTDARGNHLLWVVKASNGHLYVNVSTDMTDSTSVHAMQQSATHPACSLSHSP